MILNVLQNPKQALETLDRAKELNPNFAVDYLQIEAVSLMMLRQWEKAKKISARAIERLPESVNARINLICADVFLGQLDDALWNADELMMQAPDFNLDRLAYNENMAWKKLATECFKILEQNFDFEIQ